MLGDASNTNPQTADQQPTRIPPAMADSQKGLLLNPAAPKGGDKANYSTAIGYPTRQVEALHPKTQTSLNPIGASHLVLTPDNRCQPPNVDNTSGKRCGIEQEVPETCSKITTRFWIRDAMGRRRRPLESLLAIQQWTHTPSWKGMFHSISLVGIDSSFSTVWPTNCSWRNFDRKKAALGEWSLQGEEEEDQSRNLRIFLVAVGKLRK